VGATRSYIVVAQAPDLLCLKILFFKQDPGQVKPRGEKERRCPVRGIPRCDLPDGRVHPDIAAEESPHQVARLLSRRRPPDISDHRERMLSIPLCPCSGRPCDGEKEALGEVLILESSLGLEFPLSLETTELSVISGDSLHFHRNSPGGDF